MGGADTRLKDLISAFSKSEKYDINIIPNDNFRLKEIENVQFLTSKGVKILTWETLPEKLDGIGISFCNFRLFSESWRIKKIKSSGLKFIWSNDMMWREESELKAISNKLVDATIFTSERHLHDTQHEVIKQSTKSFIVPNYFFLENYPSIKRPVDKNVFTIGKHSRADILKYSENFPLFYENLNLKNPKYRIMGVSKEIMEIFSWYNFDPIKWDLLECNAETLVEFLGSLDAYVYNSSYKFTETQCRASIEALLTGLPVIAPNKPNFTDQIWHKKNGFICEYFEDYKKAVQSLEDSAELRLELSSNARELSIKQWCDTEKQVSIWEKIFNSI